VDLDDFDGAPDAREVGFSLPPPPAATEQSALDAAKLALSKHQVLRVVLDKSASREGGALAAQKVIERLAPHAKQAVRDGEVANAMLVERGELPFTSRVVPGAADSWGRPTVAVNEQALNSDWLDKNARLAGADALVVLEALSGAAGGAVSAAGCEAGLAWIRGARTATASELSRFVSHANAGLWAAFSEELDSALPGMLSYFAAFSERRERRDFPNSEEWKIYQCGNAYWRYLEPYAPCLHSSTACEYAPTMMVLDRLAVGFPEPPDGAPAMCSDAQFGADPVEGMRTLARSAARAITHQLDPTWVDLASRAAALATLQRAAERVCGAAGPETAAVALDAALAEVSALLASAPLSDTTGRWASGDGQSRIEGVGAVRVVASFDSAEGAPATLLERVATALRETTREQGSGGCGFARSGGAYSVLVANVGSGTVEYHGIHAARALFCD
jgi:hypothetical protein